MRKKNFFSTILSLLILIALIACGYIFFKDMDGPSIAIVPDTGRVSPHTPLQITLADPSNIRSISVGVRRNNVVTPIFQRHFEEYLPQRTVEVSLKNAGLREGPSSWRSRRRTPPWPALVRAIPARKCWPCVWIPSRRASP